jgi:toxoflavin synthase
VLRQTLEVDRHMCDFEFVTDPPTPYQHPQWNQATHEWAITEAGFREFAWHPSEVAPEDITRYGEAYWRDFNDNCLVIGLVCQK